MSALARSAAALTTLAVVNGLVQRTRLPGDLVLPASAVVLLGAARASGLSWEELGLGRTGLRRGLIAAVGTAALTGATVAAAAAHPRAGAYRTDHRYPDRSTAVRAALVTIPLAVVVPEELVFRGVLDASLRRHLAPPAASAVGALAFGAWHVLGATALTHNNEGLSEALGTGRQGRAVSVLGAAGATAAAGLGLLAMRRRADSVLPSIAAHWALNAAAALATLTPTAPTVPGPGWPRGAYSEAGDRHRDC